MCRHTMLASLVALATVGSAAAEPAKPTDPQIAHIAYTAGKIDIAAAHQALAKSHNPQVRSFAESMVRDHKTVNDKALALVKELKVTPEPNPTSAALSKQADQTLKRLATLNGKAFDRAYVQNEVAYHRTVNDTLRNTLIPDATNGQLKNLLSTGLKLFQEHQLHAEQLAKSL